MIDGWHRRVAYPERLRENRAEQVLRLYRQGQLPKSIEAWMIVTSVKHTLRAIYGCSDFRVALYLLAEATAQWWSMRWFGIKYRLGMCKDIEEIERDLTKQELDKESNA